MSAAPVANPKKAAAKPKKVAKPAEHPKYDQINWTLKSRLNQNQFSQGRI